MMKKTVLFAMGLVAVATTHAQNTIESTVSADVVSKYVWRGLELGDVAVQPTLGVGYKGLSLTAWGSYGLSNKDDVKEFDLTLGYTIGGLNIGITDYWFSEGLDPDARYFKFDAHGTNHLFEANIGYDFGFVALQWYTNFAGNDGVNKDGKRGYSSYFELTGPFRLGGLDWTATLGVVPYATTFYDANGFCVTNVSLRATRDFVIKEKYHLPVFAGLTANPRSEKLYLLFGVSFHL